MTKVILIEPVLPHYREDVFRLLSESGIFQFEIVGGRDYQGIKSIHPPNSSTFNHISFNCFGHNFYYLKGAFNYITSRNPDIIISTGVDLHLIHSLFIFIYFRVIRKKKFYWWSHATLGNQGKIGVMIRKFFYKYSTGVLTYNNRGKENLLEMGILESSIQVVNNSINFEDYGFLHYDLHNKTKNEDFTILYSGRVTRLKKVNQLIKALGLLKKRGMQKFRCYIVGSGEVDKLAQLAREEDVSEHIVFTGEKYGKENHRYFLDSDIFVCPGAIGLSILHAMSFGLPVLTNNNIDNQFPEFELLKPGFNGDLFIEDSVEDIAQKISEWKMKLEEFVGSYSDNCISRIEEMGYLPDIQSSKVLEFIE